MGKQSNKVEKRRRRLAYLERKKAKLKEAAGGNKAKLRRPVVRKEKEKEKEKEKRPTAAAAETGGATASVTATAGPPNEAAAG